jgi:SAM-dependent methyltransferase
MCPSETRHYNSTYQKPNYFRYRESIYGPYISSLIGLLRLERGASLLDVGCGQGFFAYLFAKRGMKVHGVDLSEAGIRAARSAYGLSGAQFSVADIRTVRFPEPFDCVFVRSLSLYNKDSFSTDDRVTRELMRHVKSGGVLVFAYNSRCRFGSQTSWRYHSLRDVKEHFHGYQNARVFFSLKFDTWLLGKYAFNLIVTRLNILLSRASGLGGELICVVTKGSTSADVVAQMGAGSTDGEPERCGKGVGLP